ncbi:hypothetical protein HYPSUDRAFT_116152, partial [Hypholoma sublateritium FD-334 SS-4]
NITKKGKKAPSEADLNRDGTNLFAFAWQLMHSVLPTKVLEDYAEFAQVNCLPQMDPNDPLSMLPPLKKPGSLKNNHLEGMYTVKIQGHELKFYCVLVPPSGFIGENYSRATHCEDHPHVYAAQWTVSRMPNIAEGGNFYFARYGVHVQQAQNTLIVWKPSEPHGTSLPDINPRKDDNLFCQRALAFVTSDKMAQVWEEYQ